MGRLLANRALMKNGHPPIVITRGERVRYFRMLERAQTKFAAYRLVRFFKGRERFGFLPQKTGAGVVPKRS